MILDQYAAARASKQWYNSDWRQFSTNKELIEKMVEASTDLVAVWEVHLADGIHVIEFEHGTTSGKRVLKVDREVILKNDWMFKLVGTESFKVGKNKTPCTIVIEPVGGVYLPIQLVFLIDLLFGNRIFNIQRMS